ncbi:MAG: glycosyltransferase family 39 protein [Bacteroidales bacterium]|nr:glycosyltransferase family 39 protein [Bacteroidales bacterium]
MRRFIRYCFEEKPLLFCIWMGFFFRLLAVLFGRGIAFGFDHYAYLETAQHIVSGDLTLQQLIMNDDIYSFIRHGNSVVYLYINAGILYLCEFFNLFDARSKMFIMRLAHGLLSMLTIYYCYRITYRLANRRAALAIGVLTSMLWFYPYLCVKNMPECVASVIMLAAVYRLAKTRKQTYKIADDIFTGFLLGVSVSFCYNLMIILIGCAICYILKSGFTRAVMILFGAAIAFFALEGLVDTIAFGTPFYVFGEYVADVVNGYENNEWEFRSIYMYISILAMVIPFPWGLFALFGYVKSWRHCFLLFFPVTFYVIVSYLLPNKEEKFMVSILPLFFMLCVTGWFRFERESRFISTRPWLRRWSVALFFAVNTPMLVLTSMSYMRRPQVETMVWLSHYKSDISSIFVEDRGMSCGKSLPLFYLGKDIEVYRLRKTYPDLDPSLYFSSESADISLHEHNIYSEKYFLNPAFADRRPQYVIICGDYDMPGRLASLREIFPQLTYETTCSPSFSDRVMEFFNPSNNNVNLHIYRTE